MTTDRKPHRFNHVAMSLSPDELDAQHRADILAFYGDVFGWTEMPSMTKDRERLVMACHRWDQFVFLVAEDEPMTTGRLDHFGVAVDDLAELEAMAAAADIWAAKDDRVDIIGQQVEDHEVLHLHNFYVGFLLPMKVEVQYFDWLEGMKPVG